jgi:large subunit ribosomal protein L15
MSMIHDITSTTPRYTKRTRKGRGEASKGKTSGRGGKGASARGGGPYWKRGHEGGQTSIFRRFPKRGFSNHDWANRFHVVNLQDLERFDNGATVDAAALIQAGLVPNDRWPVKILGQGNLTKKLTVTAGWYSKSAHAKINELGGAAQNLKGEAFEFPKPKKKFVPREKPAKKAAAPAAEEGAAPAAHAAGEAPAAAPPAAPAEEK